VGGQGDGVEMFKAICKLGLEGIVSKKLNAPHKSGPSKAWLKIKNPKAPAATRDIDGTFTKSDCYCLQNVARQTFIGSRHTSNRAAF
jgi:hypothetical protein